MITISHKVHDIVAMLVQNFKTKIIILKPWGKWKRRTWADTDSDLDSDTDSRKGSSRCCIATTMKVVSQASPLLTTLGGAGLRDYYERDHPGYFPRWYGMSKYEDDNY